MIESYLPVTSDYIYTHLCRWIKSHVLIMFSLNHSLKNYKNARQRRPKSSIQCSNLIGTNFHSSKWPIRGEQIPIPRKRTRITDLITLFAKLLLIFTFIKSQKSPQKSQPNHQKIGQEGATSRVFPRCWRPFSCGTSCANWTPSAPRHGRCCPGVWASWAASLGSPAQPSPTLGGWWLGPNMAGISLLWWVQCEEHRKFLGISLDFMVILRDLTLFKKM